jgi:5'-methylthioadenosine phosphorylase
METEKLSIKRVAIIGGTGFSDAFGAATPETILTRFGETRFGRAPMAGGELITLTRHGAGHSLAPHAVNYRANVFALHTLNVRAVLATAAVGSLRLEMAPGDFVIPDDLIDFTRGEVVSFFDQPGDVRHTDMSYPYEPTLRKILIETAKPKEPDRLHTSGTYVCLSGPRYETPAEIRMLAQWGGSVVGMTGAPEAILCREIGLRYASVAVVTNYGCGLAPDALDHGEVTARMASQREDLVLWLLRAAEDALSL